MTPPLQFDPQCFHYVLEYFKKAGESFYGTSESQISPYQSQQSWIDAQGDPLLVQQNPLLSKQAIIVLREELEYFAIPPPEENLLSASDNNGAANEALLELKRQCGLQLLEKRNIFTALQRNVNKENNMAEQHLIDMLCVRSVPPFTVQDSPHSCVYQRVRSRRRLGLPCRRAKPMLSLLNRARAAQDRNQLRASERIQRDGSDS